MWYFTQGVFKDSKFWGNVGLGILAILAIIDLNYPIIFNYVMFKVSVVIYTIYVIFLLRKNHKRKKKLALLKEQIPLFEEQRKKEIQYKIKTNPDFTTDCVSCKHFDSMTKACSLSLFRRKKFFKFQQNDKISYCFYWNVTASKDFLKDVE